MSATTPIVTAYVSELAEGVSQRTGKSYRYHSLTILQKSKNHNERYFLRDGDEPLAAGRYEFEIGLSAGPNGQTKVYFNNPKKID